MTKWNANLSYPIQSGHGCIGCSEAGFWDNGPFYQHLGSFPGFGIESTADTIGATAAAVTAGGVAVHAAASLIRKRKLVKEQRVEAEASEKIARDRELAAEKAESAEEPPEGGDEQ